VLATTAAHDGVHAISLSLGTELLMPAVRTGRGP
jgi:hypothetical protein